MKLSVIALLTGTLALVGCGDDGGGGQAGSGGSGATGGAGGGGGGTGFCDPEEGFQTALYEIPCELSIDLTTPPIVVPLAIQLCAKASVPDDVLLQGMETPMTHTVDVFVDSDLFGMLPVFAPDAMLGAASTTMTITNGTTLQALNQLETAPIAIMPTFSLDTIDTNVTAESVDSPVQVELSAFLATITGLGDLVPPDGEFMLSNDSDECGSIGLAVGADPIAFDVVLE
jgi:hypothetical protein